MDIDPSAPPNGHDPLEAALAAGFARARPSILDVIGRRTGSHPRPLVLRGSDDETAPPLSTSSPALRANVPQGRANYSMHGEIARGGMGVILKGRDDDLGRDVALKVLREDLAAEPDVVQRFIEEAQIGGQLQHPGIVPVYELGVMHDQRPYFAMKLIKGRTLAALLSEHRDPSSRRLLDIFASICHTLAYAHSRGVVHRDLKPANVLIGAFGEVQVVDWGLAKVLSQGGIHDERRARDERAPRPSVVHTVRTRDDSAGSRSRYGSVMGTPAYMSPEQARGEVQRLDERSDVFSLGAILCEILTGSPPYTGEGERTIVQAAEARLEDATRRLDGCAADPELVRLCKQCLAPLQSERPRSAAVLAEKIQTHLASVEQRAQRALVDAAGAKLRARSTLLLSVAGLALVVLGGGGWLWRRDEHNQRVTATASAVDAALQDVAMARGRGDWEAAATAMERARARLDVPEADETLRARVAALGEIIDREVADEHRAAQLERDNRALFAALEEVRQPDGGELYPTDWTAVDLHYGRVFDAAGITVDETATSLAALRARGVDLELAAAFDEWSSVRRIVADDSGALRLVRIADQLDSDPMRRRLRAALQADDTAALREIAEDPAVETFAAPTAWLLTHALVQAKQFDVALATLEHARRRFPEDAKLALEFARALRLVKPSRMRDAIAPYEAALALRPERAAVWHELGQTLVYLKRFDEALAVFERAVERMPEDAHLHHHVGNALTNLGRHEEALVAFERALELDPDFGPSHNDLGSALEKLGRYEEALERFQRAVALAPNSAPAELNTGVILARFERHVEALEHIERAIELAPKNAEPHFWRGFCCAQISRNDEAVASYNEALALDPKHSEAPFYLGAVLQRSNRNDEAVAAFERALRVAPDDPRPHLALAGLLLNLAGPELGDTARALPHARRAVELRSTLDLGHELLGLTLFAEGEYEPALEAIQRAIELGGKSGLRTLLVGLCQTRLGHSTDARDTLTTLSERLDQLESNSPGLRAWIAEARSVLAP